MRHFINNTLFRVVTAVVPLVAPFALAQDPGDTGPQTVETADYNDGDSAVTYAGFPLEIRARVFYPVSSPGVVTPGAHPFVVFLHGRHQTCYQGTTAFTQWPCSAGRSPIDSYKGYDYVAQVLASWDYIVISISANGI